MWLDNVVLFLEDLLHASRRSRKSTGVILDENSLHNLIAPQLHRARILASRLLCLLRIAYSARFNPYARLAFCYGRPEDCSTERIFRCTTRLFRSPHHYDSLRDVTPCILIFLFIRTRHQLVPTSHAYVGSPTGNLTMGVVLSQHGIIFVAVNEYWLSTIVCNKHGVLRAE